MQTRFDYTWNEWTAHVSHFAELSLMEQSIVVDQEVEKYFPAQYPDPPEARYKSERFALAQTYLEENIDAFERAGFVIASSKSVTTCAPVQVALYRFYSHAPDETICGEPPAVDFMLQLVRESEDWRNNEP